LRRHMLICDKLHSVEKQVVEVAATACHVSHEGGPVNNVARTMLAVPECL
jgi:hypothetical protein